MKTTENQTKKSFAEHGYVALEGFVTSQEAENICNRIAYFIKETLPSLKHSDAMYEIRDNPETIKQIPGIATHDSFFGDMLIDNRFVSLAESLLDEKVVPIGIQWFDKVPLFGKPTPPHQDGYYFMLEPNEAITMWLALDQVDDSNGCLHYVPGSHLEGMRPHERTDTVGFSQSITDYGETDKSSEVPIHAQPGDLLIHHSLTIHSASGNSSVNRHRRSLGFVYYSQRAKHDEKRLKDYQEALSNELIEQGKL